MADAIKTAQLGSPVEYRDRDGRRKAAVIVATDTSMGAYDAKSGEAGPREGAFHLMVFSFTGRNYLKHNIEPGEGEQTFTVL